MFSAPRKPKATVIMMFFLPAAAKNIVFTLLFGPRLAKTLVYAVFSMLQEKLFPYQRRKNGVNYSVLALDKRQNINKNPPNSAQNGHPKNVL